MANLSILYAGVLGPLITHRCPSRYGGHTLTPVVSYHWERWRPRKRWYLLCIHCETTSDPISTPEACVALLNAITAASHATHTQFPAHLVNPNAPFGNPEAPA